MAATDNLDVYQPPIDVPALFERCQNNGEFIRRVTGRFIRDVPAQLASIREALMARQGADAAQGLHKLRGSLGVIGANLAHEVALLLEEHAAVEDHARSRELLPRLEHEVERACRALEQLEV